MNNEYVNLLRLHSAYASDPIHSKAISYCCSKDEALVLYTTAMLHRPAAIFECGTAFGWSSMWLAAGANSDERNTARWDTPVYTFDIKPREQLFSHPLVQKIIGRYDELINAYGSRFYGRKKLFFIDGDHDRKAIWVDWDMTESVIEPGDVVIFHDVISETGARRFDSDFQAQYPEWRMDLYQTYNGIAVYVAK